MLPLLNSALPRFFEIRPYFSGKIEGNLLLQLLEMFRVVQG